MIIYIIGVLIIVILGFTVFFKLCKSIWLNKIITSLEEYNADDLIVEKENIDFNINLKIKQDTEKQKEIQNNINKLKRL